MSHAATTLDLLDRARESLSSGYAASAASARYLAASLAALRAGAAVVAARSATSPGAGLASRGAGPHDVWALTARAPPSSPSGRSGSPPPPGSGSGSRPGWCASPPARPTTCCATPRPSSTSPPTGSACRRCTCRGGWSPSARPEGAMAGFAHLHVASGFSMRYGASMPEHLVERAAEHGQGALALTDRDGLYGAVRFATACGRAGIAPVLGVDLAVEPLVPGPVHADRGRSRVGAGRASEADVDLGRAGADGGSESGPDAGRPRPRTPVRGGAIVDPRRPRVTVLARGRGGGTAPGVGWAALCRLVTETHLRGERGVPVTSPDLLATWSHPEGSDFVRLAHGSRTPQAPETAGESHEVGKSHARSRAGCWCCSAPTPTSAGRCSPGAASGPTTCSPPGGRCCRATGSPSRSCTTAGRRAPPGAARTRPTCSPWPTPPASPPCSAPRCATSTPSRCAPSTCSTPPAGSSCSTRATSTGSPTPATSPTPPRCTRAPSRSPAATAPAPTGWSR